MNDDDPLRGLGVEIHAILVAEQDPVTASQLSDKYEDLMGYYIDPKRYGFPHLDALLQTMTDAVSVVTNPVRNAKPQYRAVSKAETKDIESLVRRQMTKEEQAERRRSGMLPRRPVERRPTQFGAAFRYKSADSKAALPESREQQQMTASTQKMIPSQKGGASRFSTNFDASDEMSDSVQPMKQETVPPSTPQHRRLVDDPAFHLNTGQKSSMAFGAQVMSASAYKQQQQTQSNCNTSTMSSRNESMDQMHYGEHQSRSRAPSTDHYARPPVAPPPRPPQSAAVAQNPTSEVHYARQFFQTSPSVPQKSESVTRSASSSSSYESHHHISPEALFFMAKDERPVHLDGDLYERIVTLFKREGDKVVFQEVPKNLLAIFNLNPDNFFIEYKDESGVRVTLKKIFNRTTLRTTGHSVRPAMEFDVAWIAKTHNVLSPLQHYDAISVVHMVSPSMFLVCSLFGNENPCGARFNAIDKYIANYHKDGKLKKVTSFNPGMGCIVCYQGILARAVLLSQSKSLIDHLRFILMDIHAVIEVDVSNVFYILPELETKYIPCNLFLARIHGVGPMCPAAFTKYNDYIEEQTNSENPMTTVCVIRSVDRKYLGIDFALKGQWVSERLLSRGHASPYVCSPSSRQIARNKLPPTAVIFDVIKAMIEAGAYDFRPDMSIRATAGLCYVPPHIYQGYQEVLEQISPRPVMRRHRRFISPPPPQPVVEEPDITNEEEPPTPEEFEEEQPGLQAEERAPSADLSGFRSASPSLVEQISQHQLVEKEPKLVEELMKKSLTEDEFQAKRMAKLIDVVGDLRSSGCGDETDAVIASLIWSAITISDPHSPWTQQLADMATDLGSRHLGLR